MHKASKPKIPPIVMPPTEAELQASLADVKRQEEEELRKRKGYLSTILTKGLFGTKLGE